MADVTTTCNEKWECSMTDLEVRVDPEVVASLKMVAAFWLAGNTRMSHGLLCHL